MTRIKICGLTRVEDVELAVELGASAVGFVLEPTSPRCIRLPDVHDLLRSVPPYTYSVAVMGPFVPSPTFSAFDAVQAIGVSNDQLEANQKAVLVHRVNSEDPLPDPETYDALLLDAYSREGYGGSGRKLDLGAAKAVMAESVRPVVVAGGLDPGNVAAVIHELRPYAVDVSSGVEKEPGVKSPERMREFFVAVATADLYNDR